MGTVMINTGAFTSSLKSQDVGYNVDTKLTACGATGTIVWFLDSFTNFSQTTVIWDNANETGVPLSGWYSDGTTGKYWNGTNQFTQVQNCVTTKSVSLKTNLSKIGVCAEITYSTYYYPVEDSGFNVATKLYTTEDADLNNLAPAGFYMDANDVVRYWDGTNLGAIESCTYYETEVLKHWDTAVDACTLGLSTTYYYPEGKTFYDTLVVYTSLEPLIKSAQTWLANGTDVKYYTPTQNTFDQQTPCHGAASIMLGYAPIGDNFYLDAQDACDNIPVGTEFFMRDDEDFEDATISGIYIANDLLNSVADGYYSNDSVSRKVVGGVVEAPIICPPDLDTIELGYTLYVGDASLACAAVPGVDPIYIPSGEDPDNFATVTKLWLSRKWDNEVGAITGVYSDGDIWRYWDLNTLGDDGTPGKFTSQGSCIPDLGVELVCSSDFGTGEDACSDFLLGMGTQSGVYAPDGTVLANATQIWSDPEMIPINLSPVGYYACRNLADTDNIWRYWNGNSFGTTDTCEIGGPPV